MQDKAVRARYSDAKIKEYTSRGYRMANKRDLAIWISLANSAWGHLTKRKQWYSNPEKMMIDYCWEKWRTRCALTDRYYPGHQKLQKKG